MSGDRTSGLWIFAEARIISVNCDFSPFPLLLLNLGSRFFSQIAFRTLVVAVHVVVVDAVSAAIISVLVPQDLRPVRNVHRQRRRVGAGEDEGAVSRRLGAASMKKKKKTMNQLRVGMASASLI
jgi:hypothetical protein